MFRFATILAFLTVVISTTTPAHAGIICTSPGLPPACGAYRTPALVHAEYNDGTTVFTLTDISHSGFLNVVITQFGADEQEVFDSTLTGLMTVTPPGVTNPVLMSGPVTIMSFGKFGNVTGTFQTEMLAMNLTGGGVLVRESPTLQSTGQTTITDLGGGSYHIDSFFDIFTELSLDNGQTWIPSTGSTQVELVPEPTPLVLISLGLFALPALRRLRR